MVLIGNVDRGDKDYHPIPGRYLASGSEMPGVKIHAHMVSYLISSALDDRPVLWWWPQWGDTLWVLGWSVGGGTLFVAVSRLGQRQIVGMVGLVAVLLTGTCFITLWGSGGWLPLIPSLLGVIATAATLKLFSRD